MDRGSMLDELNYHITHTHAFTVDHWRKVGDQVLGVAVESLEPLGILGDIAYKFEYLLTSKHIVLSRFPPRVIVHSTISSIIHVGSPSIHQINLINTVIPIFPICSDGRAELKGEVACIGMNQGN